MDVERARFNMIEQQIRPWDVLNLDVLDLLSVVKREQFVDPVHRQLAFSDLELPLPCGQVMLSPKVEARMLQEAGLHPTDDVLEIGAGSGYMAALMAHRSRQVTTVDIHPQLVALARSNLQRAGIHNAQVAEGDGMQGWARGTEYDAIVLSGSVPVVPQHLLQQLKAGGRMIAIVGSLPVMRCEIITRTPSGFERRRLFDTVAAPLINAPQPQAFQF